VTRRIVVTSVVVTLALAIAVAWAGADRATVEIYPTADRLPANLLRLYLVFDRPMSAGEARTHLKLLDQENRPVEKAFLELDEELWDATGTRLTVLFDPGRIKRGLRANLELGPPLVEGRRYTLVVDAGWRDAAGRPLGTPVTKTFETIAADRASPVVTDWAIDAPAAGTRQPLVLRFPEILDRALLSSTIAVFDSVGAQVRGAIEAGPEERSWRMTPEGNWREGDYELRLTSELEDVAGNSLRRVFDAEMIAGTDSEARVPDTVTRSFTVRR
jgi:hypothetical protein